MYQRRECNLAVREEGQWTPTPKADRFVVHKDNQAISCSQFSARTKPVTDFGPLARTSNSLSFWLSCTSQSLSTPNGTQVWCKRSRCVRVRVHGVFHGPSKGLESISRLNDCHARRITLTQSVSFSESIGPTTQPLVQFVPSPESNPDRSDAWFALLVFRAEQL